MFKYLQAKKYWTGPVQRITLTSNLNSVPHFKERLLPQKSITVDLGVLRGRENERRDTPSATLESGDLSIAHIIRPW